MAVTRKTVGSSLLQFFFTVNLITEFSLFVFRNKFIEFNPLNATGRLYRPTKIVMDLDYNLG